MSFARPIRPPAEPKSIAITGASSGIGAALAQAYAKPGVTLALSGRDRARLSTVADGCRAAGAEVIADVLDVARRDAMVEWIAGLDSARPLDLVVANAGISAGTGDIGGEDEAQARDIFAVNLDGVLNTLWPAIDVMRRRRAGQLAIVSSIVGFRGLPGAPAYSASKAAVLAYGDALRVGLAGDGIVVSVICPGFVESRITETNDFPMPFLMPADKAAAIIKRGLARGRARIVFPWPMHVAVRLLQLLPTIIADALLARAPKKGGGGPA